MYQVIQVMSTNYAQSGADYFPSIDTIFTVGTTLFVVIFSQILQNYTKRRNDRNDANHARLAYIVNLKSYESQMSKQIANYQLVVDAIRKGANGVLELGSVVTLETQLDARCDPHLLFIAFTARDFKKTDQEKLRNLVGALPFFRIQIANAKMMFQTFHSEHNEAVKNLVNAVNELLRLFDRFRQEVVDDPERVAKDEFLLTFSKLVAQYKKEYAQDDLDALVKTLVRPMKEKCKTISSDPRPNMLNPLLNMALRNYEKKIDLENVYSHTFEQIIGECNTKVKLMREAFDYYSSS